MPQKSLKTARDPLASQPANPQTAIRRCCKAFQRAYKAKIVEYDEPRLGHYDATKVAQVAYRDAMPILSGYTGVRNFVACVAHGILNQAIPEDSVPQLIQAARLALSTLKQAPKA